MTAKFIIMVLVLAYIMVIIAISIYLTLIPQHFDLTLFISS